MIIDEIQKVPGLMEGIKIRIDEAKLKRVNEGISLPLMYILTGSNTHEIRERASETLDGRTALKKSNQNWYLKTDMKYLRRFSSEVCLSIGHLGQIEILFLKVI